MDRNLKRLIVYFLRDRNHMDRTKLVKSVYLFEYFYFQLFGKHYTNAKFFRHHFGPYDPQVVEAAEALWREGILSIDVFPNYYGSDTYIHSLNTDASIEEYDDIPDDVRYVADGVLRLIQSRNAVNFAYDTPPMKQILQEERELKRQLLGRRLDMTMTGPIFKPDPEKVREALKRIRERKKTFKLTKEIADHELEMYHLFADTRQRAQEALKEFEGQCE